MFDALKERLAEAIFGTNPYDDRVRKAIAEMVRPTEAQKRSRAIILDPGFLSRNPHITSLSQIADLVYNPRGSVFPSSVYEGPQLNQQYANQNHLTFNPLAFKKL